MERKLPQTLYPKGSYLHSRLDVSHDVLVSHRRGPGHEPHHLQFQLRLNGTEFTDDGIQRLKRTIRKQNDIFEKRWRVLLFSKRRVNRNEHICLCLQL
jgi:hypothetical protein